MQSSASGLSDLKTTGQVEKGFPERGVNLNTGMEGSPSLDFILTFMDVEGDCTF